MPFLSPNRQCQNTERIIHSSLKRSSLEECDIANAMAHMAQRGAGTVPLKSSLDRGQHMYGGIRAEVFVEQLQAC